MENISFSDLTGAAAVLLVFLGAYNVLISALKNHREEKRRREQPVTDLEVIVKQHEQMLKNDNLRLKDLEEEDKILLRAVKAMLGHLVNGNSTEKMSASIQEIDRYLIDRR